MRLGQPLCNAAPRFQLLFVLVASRRQQLAPASSPSTSSSQCSEGTVLSNFRKMVTILGWLRAEAARPHGETVPSPRNPLRRVRKNLNARKRCRRYPRPCKPPPSASSGSSTQSVMSDDVVQGLAREALLRKFEFQKFRSGLRRGNAAACFFWEAMSDSTSARQFTVWSATSPDRLAAAQALSGALPPRSAWSAPSARTHTTGIPGDLR